jgi:serine/threonine protein kinase
MEVLKFNLELSEDSAYAYIFNSSDASLIIKCILISSKPLEFKTNMGINKSTLTKEEFRNECDIMEIMGKNDIGPELVLCGIYNKNAFSKRIIDKEIFQLSDGTNLLDLDLEIGYIEMQYLNNYESLSINDDNEIDLCPIFNRQLNKMHELGYSHCDLHSGNVLINNDNNNIKFIDFGRSKKIDKEFRDNLYEPETKEECGGFDSIKRYRDRCMIR